MSLQEVGSTEQRQHNEQMHMKKHLSKLITLMTLAGLAMAARGADDADQLEFPQILRQPIDQAIRVGSNAVFTAQATNGNLTFQWFRNGVAMDSQTNSSLVLENVGIDDVGLYTCNVSKDGGESVPTRTASLNVFTATAGGPITVYGSPVISSGSRGGCPGAYAGYVNYIKTVLQGWGWAPTSGTTVHTAADGTTRTDTKVEYVGKNGDSGCNQTIVTVPHPPLSTKYRFSIYFPNNVPTNSYPITLVGFDP
jgi:hypothetical protein